MLNYEGKTVLITGAGSGIGEEMALQSAQKGAGLLLVGRDAEKLERVKKKISREDVKVWVCPADLSDRESIDRLVSFMETECIRPDVLVLNAGVSQRAGTLDTDFEVDRKLMDVNYFGSVYLVKKLKKMLLEAEMTRIAVNTSIAGLFGFPMRSAYSASKHALFGFFESMALEYDNIRVTFIVPGRIRTGISNSALLGDGTAYGRMDPGQAAGLSVEKCASKALEAIARGRRKVLIGKSELLMVYIYKWCPALYFRLSKRISAV